ncbi:MAG: nucleotide sugar dehydrogenase [Magnetococcales bacterium]|nr:nucleotide sugar dehydrogenase [Magnetococcales bacterium]
MSDVALPPVDLTVVGGAGHVGLPLSLAFAATGLRVLILDLNAAALESIRAGRLPAIEYGAEPYLEQALREDRLAFASDPAAISGHGPVIITIGTPVDEFLNPVHKAIEQGIDGLLPHLADDQLLILRSTVFPGTTEWLDRTLRERNRRLPVAFCPERVVQGHAIKELHSMPQIVSGATPEAEEAAARLFARIAPEIVRVSPMEAEFAKLFANAYRYIEFAAANQFYMIAQQAGVDFYKIHAAVTHNYDRMRTFPRAGFAAGPCLFKDAMQLASFASNQFSLGQSAMQVNEGLPLYVIERLRQQHDLSRMTVGLLGMAFKADVDDIRSSLSYKLRKMLKLHAKDVLATDPHVTVDPSLLPLEEVIRRSDVLVLCVPHTAYRGLSTSGKPVFDLWGFFPPTGP